MSGFRLLDHYSWGFISTVLAFDTEKFETAIAHDEYNEGKMVIVEEYESIEAAKLGHLRWIEAMKNPPEVLEDKSSSFPAILLSAFEGDDWRKSPRKVVDNPPLSI